MLGAIIGDIVGSRFEFHNHRDEEFEMFDKSCFFTDDTVLTFATFYALKSSIPFYEAYKKFFRLYPNKGFGGRFRFWASSNDLNPYYSFGNGSAMRISPIGFLFNDLSEVLKNAELSASSTHNHPEGIKGALATAHAVFLSRNHIPKVEIQKEIEDNYGYNLNFNLEELRRSYKFNETCQETVPQAIFTFLISSSFEDSIRKGISIGGDSDTIGAINGAIAEAYYGIPEEFRSKAIQYLDDFLTELFFEYQTFATNMR